MFHIQFLYYITTCWHILNRLTTAFWAPRTCWFCYFYEFMFSTTSNYYYFTNFALITVEYPIIMIISRTSCECMSAACAGDGHSNAAWRLLRNRHSDCILIPSLFFACSFYDLYICVCIHTNDFDVLMFNSIIKSHYWAHYWLICLLLLLELINNKRELFFSTFLILYTIIILLNNVVYCLNSHHPWQCFYYYASVKLLDLIEIIFMIYLHFLFLNFFYSFNTRNG